MTHLSSLQHHLQTQANRDLGPEPIAAVMARLFDRLADAELQHGHHGAAERYAARADELRGAAQ